MKKHLFVICALITMAVSAHAVEYQARIDVASCTMVNRTEGSGAGMAGGAAVGGVVGGMLGKALFGKKGTGWGAAAGALAGGYTGHEMEANKTYSCVVRFKNQKGQEVYAETLGPQRKGGETIQVFQGEDGKVLVR